MIWMYSHMHGMEMCAWFGGVSVCMGWWAFMRGRGVGGVCMGWWAFMRGRGVGGVCMGWDCMHDVGIGGVWECMHSMGPGSVLMDQNVWMTLEWVL